MARRSAAAEEENVRVDLTAMIDISFQLITFFVMALTFAKDEAAQLIRLPLAASAPVLNDDRIPNSFAINVALDDGPDGKPLTARPRLIGWGMTLDLSNPAHWERLAEQVKLEAAQDKARQGPSWKTEGLKTTVLFRLDQRVEYAVFDRIMDICRQAGLTKYQFKARGDERGPKT